MCVCVCVHLKLPKVSNTLFGKDHQKYVLGMFI